MPGEPTERVIAGSVRPDGTVRKEIRVRAGYVPLDEQPVYQSRGAKFRDASKSHVPGMDPAALAAAKAANAQSLKSKSSKKNDRRKEKRTSQQPSGSDNPNGSSANGLETSMQQLRVSTLDQSAASPASQDLQQETAKQIRALQKKLRQCEVLKRVHDAGEELTEEEMRKFNQMTQWEEQLRQLQA